MPSLVVSSPTKLNLHQLQTVVNQHARPGVITLVPRVIEPPFFHAAKHNRASSCSTTSIPSKTCDAIPLDNPRRGPPHRSIG